VSSPDSSLFSTLRDVLAPIIEADGGELYVFGLGEGNSPLRLHLGGRFAGCPGNSLVCEHIIRPTLEPLLGERAIEVSSGRLVPQGAERIRPGTAQ
jgi:Fe-S cluster biogenesis protein NfuA